MKAWSTSFGRPWFALPLAIIASVIGGAICYPLLISGGGIGGLIFGAVAISPFIWLRWPKMQATRARKQMVGRAEACARCWGEFEETDRKRGYEGLQVCDHCFRVLKDPP